MVKFRPVEILILLAVLALCVVFTHMPFDTDSQFYLSAGKLFLEHGLSLFHDQHTLIFSGSEIVPNPWIHSFLLGVVDHFFGLQGLSALRVVFHFIPLLLLYLLSRRVFGGSALVSVAVMILPILGFSQRITMRPEVPSYVFMILLLYGLDRFSQRKSGLLLGLIGLLFVVWNNVHATVTFGYLIVGAFVFASLLFSARNKQLSAEYKWPVLLVLTVIVAGFVTPYPFQYHPLTLILIPANPQFTAPISEFSEEYAFRTLSYLFVWAVLIIQMIKVYRVGNLFWFVLLGGFSILTMMIGKILPHMGIVLAYSLFAVRGPSQNQSQFDVRSQYLQVALVFIGLVTTLVMHERFYFKLSTRDLFNYEAYHPVEVVNFLNATKRTGNFFNREYLTGYMSYSLPFPIKFSADLKYKLVMPASYLDSIVSALYNPTKLHQHLTRWPYDYVVDMNIYNNSLVDTAPHLAELKVLWLGQYSTLFTKANEGYEIATKLMSDPRCLDKVSLNEIKNELTLAGSLAPKGLSKNYVISLLEIASQYHSKKSFDQFRETSILAETPWDNRLLAQIYLSNGHPQIALKALAGLPFRTISDQLMTAEAFLDLKLYSEALRVIETVSLPLVAGHPGRYQRYREVFLRLEENYPTDEMKEALQARQKYFEDLDDEFGRVDLSFFRKCS